MTRKIALLALLPAVALGLSACGSSNPDAGASPASSASSPSASSTPSGSSSDPSGEASPSTSPSEKAAPAVITIADFAYKTPASVAPGTKISIKNQDSVAHTVTSEAGGFDVKVDPGGTATMTAPNKPGTYEITCDFHANMSGKLVVE
ncbi:cupredoxin domain-containing protein [Phycicoccus flavus]|uniref:Cupredoxin domain-containing protein n=1 Tax=Phycicoccus flavus TaxID=2502783 RepID=A0A8T6R920_9MICO|nr:cupredoxin domain-containing protein [Phycicoccus flavus]NHA68711.1 cupredoxin domain-containing protein [Phycicoccus flavus]